MKLAIHNIPSKQLYRFRFLNREKLERTSRIFTHNELFFASPTQLNDPWESKPHIRIGNISDSEYKEKYVNWAFQTMMAGRPDNDPRKVREWLESHTQGQAETFAKELREEYHKSLERYRICSFSDNAMHPLLWSHYSDSHRGFCIKFDASTDIFGQAMKVTYQDDYPSFDMTEQDEDMYLRVSVLTKARFWAYEGEYRLVSMEPTEPGALPVKDHIFVFPRRLLIGVLFGCQMAQDDIDLIMEWSRDRADDIQYWRMVKNDRSFALEAVAA